MIVEKKDYILKLKGALNMCIYKIEEIAEKVRPVAEKYGIDKIYLFGSYARGEATEESDVDFLISYQKLKGLFAIGGVYSDLEDVLKKSVDIVTERAIIRNSSDDLGAEFYKNVMNERVQVYG